MSCIYDAVAAITTLCLISTTQIFKWHNRINTNSGVPLTTPHIPPAQKRLQKINSRYENQFYRASTTASDASDFLIRNQFLNLHARKKGQKKKILAQRSWHKLRTSQIREHKARDLCEVRGKDDNGKQYIFGWAHMDLSSKDVMHWQEPRIFREIRY